jgi:peptide/nickel transport system substrate-binding protein
MQKLFLFFKNFKIYNKKELREAIASFSKKQFAIFLLSISIVIISTLIMLNKINQHFMVEVPINGGKITEGIIGSPTLINPLIAISDADKDMVSLIYSGLMRKKNNNEFVPDLAESFSVSDDGLTYTFILRDNALFHNGMKVTSNDVIFTIEKAKDPIIKSPKKQSWEGINISKIDDRTIVFTLSKPYISFLNNTTLGILPSSLWKSVNVNEFNLSILNTKPIGSGPYKFKSLLKNKDGVSERYFLKRFTKFSLGKPLIKNINIIFFANQKELVRALLNKSINQAGSINSEYIENFKNNKYNINNVTLPRMFSIFFNREKNKIFSDQMIVKIINQAINKQEIINQVLGGYGTIINNPIPEKIIKNYENNIVYSNATIDEINNTLDNAGWLKGHDGIRSKKGTKNEPEIRLSFSLITGDTAELKIVTNIIKQQLEKIGIEVDNNKIYETGQLNQLIRSRDYEALFFGQVINNESDLYSFWHSSQRQDPGLNIALYNNKKVDNILESVQKTFTKEERDIKYQNLLDEFKLNIPAIFIYSPEYLYITSSSTKNLSFTDITIPADRFNLIHTWSARTNNVWKIFTK